MLFVLNLDGNCLLCDKMDEEYLGVKRPTVETYEKYLSFFLKDIPDVNCAKAGKAAYSNVGNVSTKKENVI